MIHNAVSCWKNMQRAIQYATHHFSNTRKEEEGRYENLHDLVSQTKDV